MTKNVSRSSAAMRYPYLAAFLVLIAGAFGLASTVHAADVRHQEGEHLKPTGRGTGEQDPSGLTEQHALRFGPLSTNGISYHGGPVILGTVKLYYIWYGSWDFTPGTEDSRTRDLLNTFGIHIGGSPYFNINTTYFDSTNTAVSGAVGFTALNSAIVPASPGTALSDAAVQDIVANALTTSALPTDENGVYFVLTSKDVTENSGFCTQYCAWHNYSTSGGKNIKFGFVGNPMRCPAACSAQTNTPNGNQAADAMANLIGHELAEATTDPNLNAWYDRSGQENADKCAWTFGSTKPGPNGSRYNVTFGGLNWLLQRNWINKSGGFCTLTR